MKVVINRDPDGAFTLSNEALIRLIGRGAPVIYALSQPAWYMKSEDGWGFSLPLRDGFAGSARVSSGVIKDDVFYSLQYEAPRNDPDLVAVVEEMGESANALYSKLAVVTVPDGTDWYIDRDIEGAERVHEVHRIWTE